MEYIDRVLQDIDRVLQDEIEHDRMEHAHNAKYEDELYRFSLEVWATMAVVEHHIDANYNVKFSRIPIEALREALDEISSVQMHYDTLHSLDEHDIWRIIWENPAW